MRPQKTRAPCPGRAGNVCQQKYKIAAPGCSSPLTELKEQNILESDKVTNNSHLSHNYDEQNVTEIIEREAVMYEGIVPAMAGQNIEEIKQQIRDERSQWPSVSQEADNNPAFVPYKICREAATHNMLGPRLVIKTENRLDAWFAASTGHMDDPWILDGICYGFPLQFRGPPIVCEFQGNHPSATRFPEHVSQYIKQEIELCGIVGPFTGPPFVPWCHVAPLMSRPKATPGQRRIIVDLTYPEGVGPNAHIIKNQIFGCQVSHSLPTVDDAICIIASHGFSVHLASIDIARAYRNFMLDPYDWPLTCISHMGEYYLDNRMPFGSRLSSLNMQRIALFIHRALRALDVTSLIYLDDILVICPSKDDPERVFAIARKLIRTLGLPIAWDKLVPPCRVIRFLGIEIDCVERQIRIPDDKIIAFLQLATQARAKKAITRRELQSLVGHVNHLGKAVPPARLFMNRMLAPLRLATKKWIKVDRHLRDDLDWFINFLRRYNGRSLILVGDPDILIEADSCMVGGGGWSGRDCYTYKYPTQSINGWSISELEAYNCLIAARVLLKGVYNRTVMVVCDNNAAIMSLSSGSARNPNILAVCRAFWFMSATYNLRFVFNHAPGSEMTIADTLSRVYLSDHNEKRAQEIITQKNLNCLPVLKCDTDILNYF